MTTSLLPRLRLFVALVLVSLLTGAALAVATGKARGASEDPLGTRPLFVQKGSEAANSARYYASKGEAGKAALMQRIAGQPLAIWLTGGSGTVATLDRTLASSKAQHRLPTFVLYNIPNRDCGSYSSGGAPSAESYRAWIRSIASRLGHIHAAVIVEPDALPEISCWSSSQQATDYSLIRYAAKVLSARPRTSVYLDSGNATWQPAHTMIARLRRAGVAMTRGFSLNVAGFETTRASIAYGKRISAGLGGKHFVIDTSRNGRGAELVAGVVQWCNPAGRGLGMDPTTKTASPLVDAYLWVKLPGESDGSCNGGPTSGAWWPSYALGLAKRAEQP